MHTLSELAAELGGRDRRADLTALHHWIVGHIDYVHDAPDSLRPDALQRADERHGVTRPRDHWQSPQETLARGAGDCEDCAILAYAVLRLAGLEVAQLALRYCVTPVGPHMVCQVRDEDDDWLALDLLHPDPLPVDELVRRHGYRMGYSLNEAGLSLDGELRSNIVAQWDRVLTQLSEVDGRFTVDLAG